MTTTDKAPQNKQPSMSKTDKDVEQKISPTLGDKFLERFFKQPKEITVRTWVITKDTEAMIDEKKVKLGVLDVPIAGQTYTIDYSAVQNVKGQLIYNTKYGVANGALRYNMKVEKEVDAKLRNEMSARDNLHAIWSQYRLPLIIALVAIIGLIISLVINAVMGGQLANADNCLKNEQCMVGKIATLRAQAEAERAKAEANAK